MLFFRINQKCFLAPQKTVFSIYKLGLRGFSVFFIKKFHFGSHQNSVPIAVCHSVAVCDKHPSTYISGPIAPKANCLYSFLFFQKYFPNMTAPEPLGLWTYFRTPKSERQNVARAPRNRSRKKRPRKPSDLEIVTIGRSPICRAG